jgi:hypothetical protein
VIVSENPGSIRWVRPFFESFGRGGSDSEDVFGEDNVDECVFSELPTYHDA